MSLAKRRSFRDCGACPRFLGSCIAVVDAEGRKVKVYDACCRSCVVDRVSVG